MTGFFTSADGDVLPALGSLVQDGSLLHDSCQVPWRRMVLTEAPSVWAKQLYSIYHQNNRTALGHYWPGLLFLFSLLSVLPQSTSLKHHFRG